VTSGNGVISAAQAAIEDGLTAASAAFGAAREQLGPDACEADVRKHADWLLLRSRTELLDPDRIALAAKALVKASGGLWDTLLESDKTQRKGLAAAVVAAYHGMGR
jgi:hypothetical protein